MELTNPDPTQDAYETHTNQVEGREEYSTDYVGDIYNWIKNYLNKKQYMGDIFILIFKRITIFNSILMIIHCLFHPDLGEFEYMFIVIILLLISWIAWLTGKMLNFLSRNKGLKEKKTETNNIVKSFLFEI